MKMWKMVTLAGCIFILGPGVGTPYLYIYLIPAIVLLVKSEKEMTTENWIYMILIALPLMLFTMDLIYLKVGATFVLLILLLREGLLDFYTQMKTGQTPHRP